MSESRQQDAKVLCIVPSMRIRHEPNGTVTLTRKFLEGVEAYRREWGGPVRVIAQEGGDDGLDGVSIRREEVPFELRLIDFASPAMDEQFRDAAVVLGALHHNQLPMVDRCLEHHVPVALIAEQSVRTRWQITRAETGNPLLRLRRGWWNRGLEKRFRALLPKIAGVQCNGTPTFNDYRAINRNPLLFFDTRVTESMLVDESTLKMRLDELLAGGPLRLLFSGRLVAIKGVDHLPLLAVHLRKLGVKFTLDICGGGNLQNQLAGEIQHHDLSQQVRLRGVLDFEKELLPWVGRQADLFVCCHRQGDPSCTYLETMSCGVPIVGYDNEAFAGLVAHCGVGWLSPMDNPAALAQKIAQLDRDRPALAQAAESSLKFARGHTFETTMRKRVEHLALCAKEAAR
ncbi:MAG: glycosyltransferase [Phycisphaerales bacterium]|jgi:glycosyltransferase involved in cell wall biosynthesis|nr:glycosyltransferase [Phycisphaerales bacterium]